MFCLINARLEFDVTKLFDSKHAFPSPKCLTKFSILLATISFPPLKVFLAKSNALTLFTVCSLFIQTRNFMHWVSALMLLNSYFIDRQTSKRALTQFICANGRTYRGHFHKFCGFFAKCAKKTLTHTHLQHEENFRIVNNYHIVCANYINTYTYWMWIKFVTFFVCRTTKILIRWRATHSHIIESIWALEYFSWSF